MDKKLLGYIFKLDPDMHVYKCMSDNAEGFKKGNYYIFETTYGGEMCGYDFKHYFYAYPTKCGFKKINRFVSKLIYPYLYFKYAYMFYRNYIKKS